MKRLFNKVKGFILDKKMEKKERKIAEKRAALEAAQSYIAPTLTVAACTAVALSGSFSFI